MRKVAFCKCETNNPRRCVIGVLRLLARKTGKLVFLNLGFCVNLVVLIGFPSATAPTLTRSCLKQLLHSFTGW